VTNLGRDIRTVSAGKIRSANRSYIACKPRASTPLSACASWSNSLRTVVEVSLFSFAPGAAPFVGWRRIAARSSTRRRALSIESVPRASPRLLMADSIAEALTQNLGPAPHPGRNPRFRPTPCQTDQLPCSQHLAPSHSRKAARTILVAGVRQEELAHLRARGDTRPSMVIQRTWNCTRR